MGPTSPLPVYLSSTTLRSCLHFTNATAKESVCRARAGVRPPAPTAKWCGLGSPVLAFFSVFSIAAAEVYFEERLDGIYTFFSFLFFLGSDLVLSLLISLSHFLWSVLLRGLIDFGWMWRWIMCGLVAKWSVWVWVSGNFCSDLNLRNEFWFVAFWLVMENGSNVHPAAYWFYDYINFR